MKPARDAGLVIDGRNGAVKRVDMRVDVGHVLSFLLVDLVGHISMTEHDEGM
jgi:hypothetical protein